MKLIKRVLPLIFLSLILVSSGLPESRVDKPFLLGIKAGYNQGQLRGQKTEPGFQVEKMAISTFSAGFMINWRINRVLSLQPELLYFQKGGQYEVNVPINLPGIDIKVNESRYLNYLEIPLFLKISVPISHRLKSTFLLGPSMGINLTARVKSKIKITVPNFQFSLIEKKDIRKEANDFEWSFMVGGGLDLATKKGLLVFEPRFFFGLNANHYEVLVPAAQFALLGFPMTQDVIYKLKMNNYVFSASLGYFF